MAMRRVAMAAFIFTVGLVSTPGAQGQATQAVPAVAAKTASMKKLDGFFPLYWDDATGGLWMEIPKLETEVLYQTGISAGLGSNDIGLDRGLLADTRVVSFQRVGPKVLMVQSNYDYRATTDNAYEKKAVEDAFAKSTIWGFTVAAESDGRVLVDLSDFLLRDAVNVSARLRPAAYRFERSRSAVYLPNTKGFPQNTEMEVTATLVTDGPAAGPGQIGGRIGDVAPSPEAITIRQHHSIVQLPDSNYTPRRWDPRAGYFGITFMDFAAPFGADVRTRYISRHRLEKRDPAAALSEPIKPIIYYVDRGAPPQIRDALIAGASWWNQAFEAAGFRNAFRVELMPDGADPMDVRYNVINWVHRSTRGWSYGSAVTDPRTGEIIKGHVSLGSLRAQQDYLIGEGLLSPYATGTEKPQVLTDMVVGRLRQLAAHEVGHTLGLGHNYYDSAMGRISVMDYPHPLIGLRQDGSMDFSQVYASGIGEWDKVAIAYGYSQFARAADEPAALRKILDDAWTKDLRYLTNQDTDVNPKVDQWSNGTNQATELRRIMDVRRAALAKFGEAAIQKDWPMAMLEEALVPVYLHHRYSTEAAASTLGGQQYIYALRGDGRPPTQWATAADQRAALDALLLTLKPSELALSTSLLSKIPPRPSGLERTRELFPRYTGGAFDPIMPAVVAADMTLGFVLTPERAARMVAQKAVDPSLPGFDDVTSRIITATFQPAAATSLQTEIARAVQRVVASHLMELAATAPMSEVRAIATYQLNAIEARMKAASPRPLEVAETAHRRLLAADVRRFLDRPTDAATRIVPVPPAPPGAPIGDSPLDYLLGLDGCAWAPAIR
jgi:hypothetical protein